MSKSFITNVKKWAVANRQLIIRVGIALVVLCLVAGIAYHRGRQSVLGPFKSKPVANLFSKLPDMKKKGSTTPKKASPGTKAPITETSSGFYRLSGTVQAITKDNLTLKLANGSVITLQTPKELKYYVGRDKKPLKELTKNTQVMVTGNISSDGSFTANTAQANK